MEVEKVEEEYYQWELIKGQYYFENVHGITYILSISDYSDVFKKRIQIDCIVYLLDIDNINETGGRSFKKHPKHKHDIKISQTIIKILETNYKAIDKSFCGIYFTNEDGDDEGRQKTFKEWADDLIEKDNDYEFYDGSVTMDGEDGLGCLLIHKKNKDKDKLLECFDFH